MPLITHATTPAKLKVQADLFNKLEADLAQIDPTKDPIQAKSIQDKMDEARRLFNIGGGSTASDPSLAPPPQLKLPQHMVSQLAKFGMVPAAKTTEEAKPTGPVLTLPD